MCVSGFCDLTAAYFSSFLLAIVCSRNIKPTSEGPSSSTLSSWQMPACSLKSSRWSRSLSLPGQLILPSSDDGRCLWEVVLKVLPHPPDCKLLQSGFTRFSSQFLWFVAQGWAHGTQLAFRVHCSEFIVEATGTLKQQGKLFCRLLGSYASCSVPVNGESPVLSH